MKYLCLCYYDTEKFAALTNDQKSAVGEACHPYDLELRATGKVLFVGSLSEPADWRTIKPENGKPVVSQGSISGSTSQAGAFIILEADSIEEATQVASKHPAANYGEHLGFAVDVRLCESFD
jgi:hypothetical protein